MWHAVYNKNPEIVKRKIADELILVPVSGALTAEPKIYSLNAVGEYIFDRLDGKTPLQDILQAVLTEFAVTEEQAKADISRLIDSLLQQGLISRKD